MYVIFVLVKSWNFVNNSRLTTLVTSGTVPIYYVITIDLWKKLAKTAPVYASNLVNIT